MAITSRNPIMEITNETEELCPELCPPDLCPDVLELIFKKLNFLDLANSRLVCSSWNSVAKYVQTSYLPHKKAPFLMIPPLVSGDNFSLCDIEDRRNYNLKTNMGFAFSEESNYYHVGSSHGCLIFLNEDFDMFVLNPFTGSRLKLPDFTDGEIFTLNSLDENFVRHGIPSDILRLIKGKSPTLYWLRFFIVRKVIFSANPFSGNKFSAVMICSDMNQLAYFNAGQDAWTLLDPEKVGCSDVVFDESKLYAVDFDITSVEAWDFSGSFPVKFMTLYPEVPPEIPEDPHVYLVKLSGRILMVTRTIERVTNVGIRNGEDESDGEIVIDSDHRIMNHNEDDKEEEKGEEGKENNWYFQEPHPQKYRTTSFDAFELNTEMEQLVELKSLEGWAIFLGGNDTVSVSIHQEEFASLESGAIYFTDDNWDLMDLYPRFGGHDRGIFNIRENNIKVCDGYGFCPMKPLPCWIVANPW